MNTVIAILEKERNELNRFITKLKSKGENKTKGYLRIDCKKNRCQYYYVESNKEERQKRNGRYIKKEDMAIVKAIAQRDYDNVALKRACERIKLIDAFINKYSKTDLKQLYNNIHPKRRELIETDVISDEEYVFRWENMKYIGKGGVEEDKIVTERGENVRSKSEKIIADKLYMLGIPYRYECPLVLDNNFTVYPDFTILIMPDRKEVYLEHFGMLDDEEYFDRMLLKLNTYEKNGIYLGSKLFFTYETSRKPINTKALNNQLREWFRLTGRT